jgi:two-component system NarL family response regulator
LENPLTQREQEILALVAGGKAIRKLHKYCTLLREWCGFTSTLLQKLEVRDRTQAAVIAIQKGLVAEELLGSQS